MAKQKVDLRKSEWREAIVKISDALKDIQLTDRALSLLIADSCRDVSMGQVRQVLGAIRGLKSKYLK